MLIAACYGAAVVFIGLLFVVAWSFARVPLWQFLKYTREEFLLALGTASTEAVMPRIMTKLTNAGCSRATTGLVVPTGYSFNLDGAAIYLSISLLFLAQAFGHHLDLGQQLAALGVLLLTSKGMAGVPGSSFLALSATAAALGIFPVAGVALLLGSRPPDGLHARGGEPAWQLRGDVRGRQVGRPVRPQRHGPRIPRRDHQPRFTPSCSVWRTTSSSRNWNGSAAAGRLRPSSAAAPTLTRCPSSK
jgi:hypothetical protein